MKKHYSYYSTAIHWISTSLQLARHTFRRSMRRVALLNGNIITNSLFPRRLPILKICHWTNNTLHFLSIFRGNTLYRYDGYLTWFKQIFVHWEHQSFLRYLLRIGFIENSVHKYLFETNRACNNICNNNKHI